ncbi:MAG TPA: hypothetical protein VER76_01515 [Pyrinomonadaceae bacterium]|nr:hypothetical protein [Pyrinomonadaceae bacterium]
MNDQPRQTLSRIIREHGRAICETPKRVEALLRDLAGAHRREINIIVGALEERVAADLLAAGRTVPRDVLLARLAARLRDNLAYTPEAARWGVETWAVALGIISEAELRERARAEAAESAERDAARPAQDAEPQAAKPARAAPTTSQQQGGATNAPARQPSPSPKASPPPTIVTLPAAPPRRMPTLRPPAPVTRTSQQNVAPTPPARDASRRGLTLRGCVIVVVLLIFLIVAAVLVVPAVIMLLKEEQAQPSINEPRIR